MRNIGKGKLLALLLLPAVIGMTAGCGETSGTEKSELDVAMNAEPETYDLGKTTGTTARQMMLGNVYEMLMSFDENYDARPELADEVDVSPDYTEYVYHLRKGIKFHNGEEMTADDVVASMNRWIKNNGQVKKAVGDARFEKLNEYTVKIKMDKPLMSLNEMIAGLKPAPIIVPASVIRKADPKTGAIKDYIGTGPYMVDEIKPNNYISLKKFDYYTPYGEKGKTSGWVGYKEAKTPEIVFHFVGDASTRVAGMESGEYDVAVQLPFDDYDRFKDESTYEILKEGQGDIGIVYNKKEGVAKNALFRRAVNAALNRDDIMTAAYTGKDFYKLTPSFITDEKNFWYNEEGKDVYNVHDREKAKELLSEAGYNGEEFKLLVSNHYQEFYNAAIVVERELKEVGINAKLDVVDWPTYLTRAKDKKAYDAFLTGFPTYVVPGTILYMSPTWNGWSDDPKLQGLLDEVAHATDKDVAKKAWEKAQAYSWNEYMPASKLGNRYVYNVASTRVHDLPFFEGPHMWNATVDEP